MDLSTLELDGGSFVDAELRKLETDLLYRVKLSGRAGPRAELKARPKAWSKGARKAGRTFSCGNSAGVFGPLDAEVAQRLQFASLEELDAMAERVLDARTLDEVLDDD